METGQTVVLLNLQNLYESLYDALNQYYVTLGGQNYVDLGLGTHRVKCRVHQNFKLIVIEEKEVVYEQFPIPLINRLEKHYLDIKTVLTEEQKVIATQLEEWVNKFVSSEKKYDPSDVFIGYHSDTCSSVVMQVTECESTETDAQVTLNKAKDILLNCATPDSVVRLDKSKLPNAEREHLMQEYVKEARHSSLGDYIVYHIQQPQQSHFLFTEVTTFSRLLTAVDTQHLQSLINLDAVQLLSLQQFDTQYSFLKKIRDFLGSTHTDKVLIIQAEYDEGFHKKNIISSAKYACFSEVNKCHTTDDIKTFVYFVIKLPRMEGGTSYVGFQGGPWRSVHIDDIRRSKEFLSDALSLKNRLISDLFKDPSEVCMCTGAINYSFQALECLFDTTNLVRSCVQSAVSMLRDEANSGEFSTKRVENLLTLLDGNHTQGLFAKIVRKRLHSLLKDNEANMPILKSWVLNEASNDSALQEGGTFLHTLWRKIQAVVTPLLAYLVSVIDRDCNMDLLLEDEEQIVNLWLEIFGNKEMLSLPYVRVEKKEFFKRYLQDFVSMTMKVASDEELQVRLLCQAMASCADEVRKRKQDNELFLPLIHIAYRFYQNRLQNLARMISLHPEVISPLQKNPVISGYPSMVLDVYAAKACVESLEPSNLENDTVCQRWLRKVKKVQASLELICSQSSSKKYGEHCRKYCLSSCPSSKVLQENSDVKSTKGFEAVVKVLKSCKQEATNQLFRFGLECGVCMREPQETVGLPCNHIYCLTCIKNSLDAGRTSCPKCRQQLPDDFQPHVSEDISASVKKNAEFRRCCNGFFVDLLSAVCFKDNTPPAEGVITHLLSYLMIETEHKQIHTKVLSPFEESPDKNPVVRSVILKLLLKFSFDEVQKYLQQHFSSVEESRFVDDGDRAELYALYINCLEVKLEKCCLNYGGLMDQYLVYGEEYKSVRKAVAKAVVDEQWAVRSRCTASPKNRTVFLLLALFREVTTLYRSENGGLHPTPEQCIKFDDLIEGSTYLHQAEVRRFASALVYNRLGALTVQPGSAIMENTITELIIHLAAVLLTGNHHLLMPQKHLGLSPENMQRAFIPTMPDDMLAVAQINLYYVFFTVCPNNHPCCVGMCGRPMERGRCLECGEEVGGEHHIALPGFTQVPLHEDQTRPGHILGDPERRNNPDALDTKHMSLTPFTLVRLVTHLAMMLGASEKPEIIQPPVEDVSLFLRLHIIKDLEQLSQALGKGADDNITSVHLVLKSLQELPRASSTTIDPYLTTKESRNTWETTVVTDIMTPKLKDLDQVLQEANGNIRNDSRVSSNFIIRTIHGDDCSFLASLQQCSEVDSSAVWSCRERLSLLSLTHIMETNDQKEELPLLWRFLQKEREFRLIKFLPEILNLQKRLVRKYQNATEDIVGSIREFIDQQWYQKHIETFLKTWNQLRVSVTNEIKIPEEFCSRDLDLDSDLRYLLPRRQGPGLCATGLVSYLVTLHNELVNAVDHHTREDSSDYTVSLTELTEQHVISYDVEKDLLPLILSNCQYSLECGHETISEYDLPRIQQQILTRFLQGKPLITRAVSPHSLVWLKHVQLDSYSEVCEALKIVELLLGYLSMTGGDPTMKLVTYLQEILKMDQNINQHILKAFGKCDLKHCVCLWQVLSSLRSEKMLQLKREPFSGYPAEYQVPLTEENKTELKRFMSRGNVDQWLLEMHEFLLLRLGRLRATEDYNPSWSLKEAVSAYMDRKEVEVALYVEENFSENVLLSQIIETWKYTITAKQELMNE
uniref:Ring finger protein 213 n=1 Tax=Oreochromis niloticus TaxID=8128 RepID=I3K4G6_ORENI